MQEGSKDVLKPQVSLLLTDITYMSLIWEHLLFHSGQKLRSVVICQ